MYSTSICFYSASLVTSNISNPSPALNSCSYQSVCSYVSSIAFCFLFCLLFLFVLCYFSIIPPFHFLISLIYPQHSIPVAINLYVLMHFLSQLFFYFAFRTTSHIPNSLSLALNSCSDQSL